MSSLHLIYIGMRKSIVYVCAHTYAPACVYFIR